MKTFTDQIGNQHIFESTPKRIVSIVPSQTELLYDLGLEDSIVGITKFCVHPIHFNKTKTIVGGTKNINFEKVKALNPDVIIANKEENTKEIVEKLSQICPVIVTDIYTIEDNLQMILALGKLFNKRIEAQKWFDKITFAYHDFQNFIKDKPTKKVAYFIWKDPYMVAGSDNFINELLKLNHFTNIFQDSGRYPEIALEKLQVEKDLDLLFLSSEPFPFTEEHALEIKKNALHSKTVLVDGEMFSWYGSRLLKAFTYFKKLHLEL